MAKIIDFKKATEQRSITTVSPVDRKCHHAHIIVDESLAHVECADCGERVDPMFFLVTIAKEESRIRRQIEDLKIKLEKVKNKIRCKCEHCEKMTRIIK